MTCTDRSTSHRSTTSGLRSFMSSLMQSIRNGWRCIGCEFQQSLVHDLMILTMHNQRSFIDHLSLFGIYLNYSRPKRYFRISVQILSPAKYLFNWPVCCNYFNLFSLSPSLSSIDDRDLFTESTSPRGMHHQICG